MASRPDLTESFGAMEALVEAQPEGVCAEVARGDYLVSPRPSAKHGHAQVKLASFLVERLGRASRPRLSGADSLGIEPFSSLAVPASAILLS